MRSTIPLTIGSVLFSFVVPAVAQATLPLCATTCLEKTLASQTTCQSTDIPCICADQPLGVALQQCILGECTLKEALVTINSTNAMCGIPIRDRTHYIIQINIVFGILALFALAIRMLVALQRHTFGHDDTCAVVAYVFAAPVTFGQVACGYLGFGKDSWAVPAGNIYKIMKIVYFNQLGYFISSSASKLCFLFMFLRIFPDQRAKRFCYVGIGLSLLFPVAFGLPMIFACKPIAAVWYSWDMETKYDHCIKQSVFWFVVAAYNIALDVYIVIIPIPELLKLNLSTRKKIMIMAIFSTGIITIIVSIARLWALAQYGSSTNPIYDNVLSGIFSPLELNIGIICMCMPAFRRFIAPIIPMLFSSSSSSKYRNQNSDPKNLNPANPDPNMNDPANGPANANNVKTSSGKRSDGKGNGKMKKSFGASLLETTMKSESTGLDNSGEDQEGLTVEMRRLGEGGQQPGRNKDPRGRFKVNNRHLQ